MWWGWHGRGYARRWNWWPFLLIFLGIALFSGWGHGWFMWMILFFFVIPIVRSLLASGWTQHDGYEKRKRNSGNVVIVDKPKRAPQYAVGDDGELVEVYDDEVYEEKPKRLQTGHDDFDYV
jgi:hypothetical protein